MSGNRWVDTACILGLLGPLLLFATQLATATLHTSAGLPQKLVNGLNPDGWLLFTESNGLREPICEIFLAKTVAAHAASATGNLRFTDIKEGALIGVVHLLPEATEDYSADIHNQKLEPGYYTLRYAVLPAGTYEHGVEMGEFVVLTSAASDPDPARILSEKELKDLRSSSSEVAATMPLAVPDPGTQKFPAVKMDDSGACTFQVLLKLAATKNAASKDLALGILMLTPIPHPEGS